MTDPESPHPQRPRDPNPLGMQPGAPCNSGYAGRYRRRPTAPARRSPAAAARGSADQPQAEDQTHPDYGPTYQRPMGLNTEDPGAEYTYPSPEFREGAWPLTEQPSDLDQPKPPRPPRVIALPVLLGCLAVLALVGFTAVIVGVNR